MPAYIVTCFESNQERCELVKQAFQSKGYQARIVTSDFSHINKAARKNIPGDCLIVNTMAYKRNLSISRMISHYRFAKDAFKLLEKQEADLIWLMAPANSLIKQAYYYKKKRPQAKIIIDMIDMWPESLPININKNIFPLNIWKNIRSKYLRTCDYLVRECDLYNEQLSIEYNGKSSTLYWAKEENFNEQKDLPADSFNLIYIGSINNIIDIDRMKEIIKSCKERCLVHIIGDGENKEKMVAELSQVSEVIYHGSIYDKQAKQAIFNKCHAGLNIYKEGLYIGLTVKCLDYFANGLPIINNIPADSFELVEKYDAGVNIKDNLTINWQHLKDIRNHNDNIRKLYQENFSKDIFIEKCQKIITEAVQ